jgi:hypothetical protein
MNRKCLLESSMQLSNSEWAKSEGLDRVTPLQIGQVLLVREKRGRKEIDNLTVVSPRNCVSHERSKSLDHSLMIAVEQVPAFDSH